MPSLIGSGLVVVDTHMHIQSSLNDRRGKTSVLRNQQPRSRCYSCSRRVIPLLNEKQQQAGVWRSRVRPNHVCSTGFGSRLGLLLVVVFLVLGWVAGWLSLALTKFRTTTTPAPRRKEVVSTMATRPTCTLLDYGAGNVRSVRCVHCVAGAAVHCSPCSHERV